MFTPVNSAKPALGELHYTLNRAAFDRIPSYKPQPDEPPLPVIVVTENAPIVTKKGRRLIDDLRWEPARLEKLREAIEAAKKPVVFPN